MGLSSLFYLFILAATMHLNVSASPLTLTPRSNALLLPGVSIRPREHRCTDFTFMWSLIRAQDCSNAILYLPHSHVIGTFHSAGPDDLFKTPHDASYGQCGITIHFDDPKDKDEASWLGIGIAAAQLNAACARHGEGKGLAHNGGWITAGENSRLKVTLHKTKLNTMKMSNGTVDGSTVFL